MGFSIFCILESCLLVANAIAILNDRFLIPCKTFNHRFLFNLIFNKYPFAYKTFSLQLYIEKIKSTKRVCHLKCTSFKILKSLIGFRTFRERNRFFFGINGCMVFLSFFASTPLFSFLPLHRLKI